MPVAVLIGTISFYQGAVRLYRLVALVAVGSSTYLVMLATIVIIGITLAATGEVWHIAQKREKEQELLFVGDQFRRAISLYYAHAPALGRRQLESLEDLLQDPRYPSTQRYLRKIYADLVSGGGGQGAKRGDFWSVQPV